MNKEIEFYKTINILSNSCKHELTLSNKVGLEVEEDYCFICQKIIKKGD